MLACALSLALLLSLATTSTASALSLGVNWSGNLNQSQDLTEWDVVQQSGSNVYRLGIFKDEWYARGSGYYDTIFQQAAERNITIHPYLVDGGYPQSGEPAFEQWYLWAKSLVKRYGYNGSFWAGKPYYKPVTAWELGNEPNLIGENGRYGGVVDPVKYGNFLVYVANAIRTGQTEQSGGSTTVLMGGLYLGPVGKEGSMKYDEFLNQAYGVAGFATSFDGMSIHPYGFDYANASNKTIGEVEAEVNGIHSLLAGKPSGSSRSLWVTEIGWPVGGTGQPTVTEAEQERLLRESFNWIKGQAGAKNIQTLIWYNLRDDPSRGEWAYRDGLLRGDRSYRPAWSEFQRQTGAPPQGDAHPVSMRDPVTKQFWVYYRGSNGYLWELYRDPETGNWFNNQVPATQAAAMGTSPVIGRNATTNAQWIYYQGVDGYIWELYRDPKTGSWFNTKIPNAQAASPGSSPTMLGDPTTGEAWIYYRGSDGYLWELYRNPSNGLWASNKVPAAQAAAAQTTPVIGRNATTNAQWIYYQGADGYIWELYRDPKTGSWFNTKIPNAQAASPGSSLAMMGDPTAGAAWIYYRGADGYLWELYRNPSNGLWASNKVPAAQAAAAQTTPVIGRNATTNAQWIYYQGADGYIWELYRDPKTGNWFNTKIPNAQVASPGSSPTMLGDPTTGEAWIEYRGSDGNIWQLWRNPSTGVWANGKLQASSVPQPIPPGDAHPVSMRDPVTNQFWIYYRSSNGYMRELYRDPKTGNWFNNQVPATQASAMGTSPVIGRNATTNAQWIYYQGADGYIWELYRDPKTGSWFNTKIPNAQAASPGSSLAMMGDPTAGAAWIYYRGADGYLWELYRDPETGNWFNSKVPAAQPAAGQTTPVIGRNATTNAQWIYYQGADGYLWELYRNPSNGLWANTKIPNAQAASPGSSPTMLGDPTAGAAWIYYRGSDGYIWELWRNPSTGVWAKSKVPATQAAAAQTTPVIGRNATTNAQWIYYQGADGYIWELYRDPKTGSWFNTKIPNAQAASPGSSLAMLGDPTTGEAWIEYRGSDGYIWELWRNPSTGVWANGKFTTAQM